jgi:hypothetical protein
VSGIQRKPRKRPPISREEWRVLYDHVLLRDRDVVIRLAEKAGLLPVKLPINGAILIGTRGIEVCPAWVMDPNELGVCWGLWKIDHVQEWGVQSKGLKAPDDEDHLLSLCAGHDERGMRQGRVWNLSHRELEWRYLLERRRERESRPDLVRTAAPHGAVATTAIHDLGPDQAPGGDPHHDRHRGVDDR